MYRDLKDFFSLSPSLPNFHGVYKDGGQPRWPTAAHLLLQDIRLGAPLPDQQLAEARAPYGQPLAAGVDGDGRDPLLRNAGCGEEQMIADDCRYRDKRTIAVIRFLLFSKNYII